MKKVAAHFILAFFIAAVVLPLADNAHGNVPPNASFLSYYSEFGKKITLRGVFAADRVYFTVDKHWNVQEVMLRLIITQSELLDGQSQSVLTISVNGHPVSSRRLKDLSGHNTLLELPLFLDYIKAGVNEVKLEVYRRIGTQPCADDVTNGNWVTFGENSVINIKYTEKPPTSEIGEWPYPFFRQSTVKKPDTAVLLPDNPENAEVEAALYLSGAFGRYAQTSDCDLTTARYGQYFDKGANNIIYIGLSRSLPQELSSLIPAGTDLANAAVIKKCDSPFEGAAGKKLLIITASEGEDLIRAVRLLCNDQLVAQIKSDFYRLERGTDILSAPIVNSDTITFDSLGYNGFYVSGPFRQFASLGIKLPHSRAVDDLSKIGIHFRYAENLDFKRSMLTLFVNGVPIGSKKLEKEKAQNDFLELEIPKEARKGSFIELKAAFDLDITDLWCTLRPEDNPWAYILGTSYFYVPTASVSTYLFENYPAPFASDDMWNNTLFVAPDNISNDYLDAMADIASMIGRDIRTNRGELHVARASALPSDSSGKNIICIGTPGDNPYIRVINNNLYYKYSGGFDHFDSTEKLKLLAEYSRTLSAIELIDSPQGGDLAQLCLTAPVTANLKAASVFITQPSMFAKLSGDCALIDPSGKNINFKFKSDKPPKVHYDNGKNKPGSQVPLFLTFAGIVLIAIVAGGIMYYKYNRFEK